MSVWFFTAVALVLGLDQASKSLALARDPSPRHGAAIWGVRLGGDLPALVVLWGATVLGTILLARYFPSFQGRSVQGALGAAVGGTCGNLLDTVRRGTVVDFIDLRVWPVFNLADVAIVFGVAIVLWTMA